MSETLCSMCEDPIRGQVWKWEGDDQSSLCEPCAKTLISTKVPNWPLDDKPLCEEDSEFLKKCGIKPYSVN
jgi:hypothetical protein